MESEKAELIETASKMVVTMGYGVGIGEMLVQGYKLATNSLNKLTEI